MCQHILCSDISNTKLVHNIDYSGLVTADINMAKGVETTYTECRDTSNKNTADKQERMLYRVEISLIVAQAARCPTTKIFTCYASSLSSFATSNMEC